MRRREFLAAAGAALHAAPADPPVVAAARARIDDYWRRAGLPPAEFLLGDLTLLRQYQVAPPRDVRPETYVVAPAGGKLLVCGASDVGR